MYESINFKDWPFKTVPDAEFAQHWAGRKTTIEQLKRLLWKAQFTSKSAIHLLWANFGMGKTHTLLHTKYLAEKTEGNLIPIYAVMPKRAKGFLEVYRAIVSELPFEFLGDQLVKIGTSYSGSLVNHPMFKKSPGVVNCILSIRSGDAEKQVYARQWIEAKPGLSSKELRAINVTYRIKTPEDAINALDALTQMLTFSNKHPKKVLIMLDEYQRIGELKTTVRQEVNAGMHGYFDDNPSGLELLLSFSFGNRENLPFLLSNELLSRSEPQSLSLDVFTIPEAMEFIKDLLSQFRIEQADNWSYPLSTFSVNRIIHYTESTGPITPRRLMLVFNHTLMESLFEVGPDIDNTIPELIVNQTLERINGDIINIKT